MTPVLGCLAGRDSRGGQPVPFGVCPETAPVPLGASTTMETSGRLLCAPTVLAVGRRPRFLVGLPCGFFRKVFGTPARAKEPLGCLSPGGCRKRPVNRDEHTIHDSRRAACGPVRQSQCQRRRGVGVAQPALYPERRRPTGPSTMSARRLGSEGQSVPGQAPRVAERCCPAAFSESPARLGVPFDNPGDGAEEAVSPGRV